MAFALPPAADTAAATAADTAAVALLPLADGECLLCAVLSDVAAVIAETRRLDRQTGKYADSVKRARASGLSVPASPDLRPRVVCRFPEAVVASVERLLADIAGDYRHSRLERQRCIARRLAALPELGLTLDGVERHHHYHRTAVIGGVGRATRSRVELLELGLRPREAAVLHMVARLGVVSVAQAAVLMGAVRVRAEGKRGRPYERVGVPARLDLASKLLCRLTADELLVGLPLRFVPGARRPGKPAEPRKAWAITQRAIAVYESARDGEPHDYKLRTLPDPRAGVGARKLRHDLGVGDLLVSLLAHTLSEPVLTLRAGDRDRELRVNVSPENWWGAQHLLMAYTPPTRIEGQRGEVSAARFIAPDGFCVIGVRGPVEDVALPLLVEHDSGIRSLHEVTDQLQAHAESARSGALSSRFPELAGIPAHTSPDGQRPAWVPVLFATRGMRRAGNIARAAAERDKAVRYWQPGVTADRPPQYATASHRVHELGLLAPVLSLHAPERGEQPLLHALLTDYRHWLTGQLPAHDAILTLDRKGALGDKGAISRTPAPRRRADAQREREVADVKHRELDVIRTRQREREAEREGRANAPAQWSVSGDV